MPIMRLRHLKLGAIDFLRTEGLKRKRVVSTKALKRPGRYQPLLKLADKIIYAEAFYRSGRFSIRAGYSIGI